MTIKLYDEDSLMQEFDATVTACFEGEKGYGIILDRTCFFYEGGGQNCDKGEINGEKVLYVEEQGTDIVHYLEKSLQVGDAVHGKIDIENRKRSIQNHSAEHIVSGLIHNEFGYDNVGFHLGEEFVTMDFNGKLSDEDVRNIEFKANKVVWDNVKVNITYPSKEELKNLSYRSKLDLEENVRIVEFEGVDFCACCAPHVKYTGEIGIIKIINKESYKGGSRLYLIAGKDAYLDYKKRFDNSLIVAKELSCKPLEAGAAVEKYVADALLKKEETDRLLEAYIDLRVDTFEETKGNIVFIENGINNITLRKMVNKLVNKCAGICVGLMGNDKEGYSYIIASENVDLKEKAKEINEALNGRGGGQKIMISGRFASIEKDIRSYFDFFLRNDLKKFL